MSPKRLGQRPPGRAAAAVTSAHCRSGNGVKKKKLAGAGASAGKAAGKRKSQHALKVLKDLEKENGRLLKLLRQNEKQLKEAREVQDAQALKNQNHKTKKIKSGKGGTSSSQVAPLPASDFSGTLTASCLACPSDHRSQQHFRRLG